MTVKELKNKLDNYPDNWIINILYHDYERNEDNIYEADEVYIEDEKEEVVIK